MTDHPPNVPRMPLVVVAEVLLILAVLPVVVTPDLPDPLASRWDSHGAITQWQTQSAQLRETLIMVLPLVVGLMALAAFPRLSRRSRVWFAGFIAALGTWHASWGVMVVLANQGHGAATEVGAPPIWHYAVALVASIVAMFVTARLAMGTTGHRPLLEPPSAIDVPDTAGMSWSQDRASRRQVSLGVALLLGGLLNAEMGGDVRLSAWLPIAAVLLLATSRIRVFADRRGLTVGVQVVPWARECIPIGEIEVAGAEVVTAADLRRWWSSRGPLLRSAPIARTGESIVVDLVDGDRLAVRVDDARTAAAVLNREVARHRRAVGQSA